MHGEGELLQAIAEFLPPPKKKIRLSRMAKGWSSPGTRLRVSRGSKRSPGRAQISASTSQPCTWAEMLSCTAWPRPRGVLGSSHPRPRGVLGNSRPANAPCSPGCDEHVEGSSDPTARGTFIASIRDNMFSKHV